MAHAVISTIILILHKNLTKCLIEIMIITLAIPCSLVIIITDGVMLCNSFKGLTSLYLPMCFSSQKGFNGKVDIKFQCCLYLIF